MNRNSILTLTALAAFAVCAPFTVANAKEKPASAEKAASDRPVPYHGKVASVDAAAKTFTIKGKEKDRVFSITEKTTITKDGAAADIAAITAGDEVRGQATKSGDNWEAVKVMLGAKAAGKKKDEAKPADSSATGAAKPAEAPASPAPADTKPDAAPASPAEPAPAK